MMVVDHTTTTTATPEVTPTVPPAEGLVVVQQQPRDRDSSIAERGEVNEEENEMVDYSNNRFFIAIGFCSWLIIVAANVYVIVELGLGGPP